jgi:hypothetical protein
LLNKSQYRAISEHFNKKSVNVRNGANVSNYNIILIRKNEFLQIFLQKSHFSLFLVLTFPGNGRIITTVNEARTTASAPGGIYKQETGKAKPIINPREP